MSKALIVKCPTCEKAVAWNDNNEFKPFCSQRCKLIDLGEWASEDRRIEADPEPSDKPEELDIEEIEYDDFTTF